MKAPLFTRKDLKASSTKRPFPWNNLSKLITRFSVALEEVVKGNSSEWSRVDIATLYNFIYTAKKLGHIEDGGLIDEALPNLARAYSRMNEGKAFRLDGISLEAVKECIPAYEMLAKSLSEREYMTVCNAMREGIEND